MALVPCPECHKEVSTEARACPQCAFPFPGKNISSGGHPAGKVYPCPHCDSPVSQHAQTCLHCGSSLSDGHRHQRNNGETIQEILRCPHCGLSYTYTRTIPQSFVGASVGAKDTAPAPLTMSPSETMEIPDSRIIPYPDDPVPQSSRRRPPLWQDPSGVKVPSPPRYPRNTKKSIIVGLILLAIVAMSVVFGAMWQLKGLNPLEAILYWRI